VLLSEPFPSLDYKKALKVLPKRIIITVWVLCCTVLLSGFSGLLRGLLMKSNSLDVIDSFEELFLRNDMKIIAIRHMNFELFINEFKGINLLAQEFSKRLIIVKKNPLEKPKETLNFINKLKYERMVMVIGIMNLENVFINNDNKLLKVLLRRLYISKNSFDSRYYSLPFHDIEFDTLKDISEL
jgi:hypothetical protein